MVVLSSKNLKASPIGHIGEAVPILGALSKDNGTALHVVVDYVLMDWLQSLLVHNIKVNMAVRGHLHPHLTRHIYETVNGTFNV